MMKTLIAVLVLASGMALASDVYVAQASAGANTGANCANARAVSSLSGTDWGSDKNVHLCGNVTSQVTIATSGTSGHPTQLIFESGATMTQASWGSVCVITANKDWWIVDGGGTGSASGGTFVKNGVISNTNVSSTANSTVDTNALCGQPANNAIVKNLAIENLFVKTTNDNVGHGDGPHLWGNSDQITNNLIHDSLLCATIDYLNTQTGGEIDHNLIYNCNQGIISADRNSSSISTGMLIHDNQVHDWAIWDNPAQNTFHHNGVFIEVNNNTAQIVGLQVYNNYFWGDPGVFMTGEIFLDAEGSGTNGSYSGALLFNNVMVDSSTANTPSNGLIITKANGGSPTVGIYNNTQIYPSSNKGRCTMNQGAVLTLKNNIAEQCALFVYLSAGTAPTSDYNDLFQNTGTDTSEGIHSITSDPTLNATTFIPNGGSAVIAAALNLSSLSVTALNSDKVGTARGSSWAIGALQPSGTPQASTPTFSPSAPYSGAATSVTITCATGPVACYANTNTVATNGAAGCTSGTLYTAPIVTNVTTTYYAVCGGTSFTDSAVTGPEVYTISATGPDMKMSGLTVNGLTVTQ